MYREGSLVSFWGRDWVRDPSTMKFICYGIVSCIGRDEVRYFSSQTGYGGMGRFSFEDEMTRTEFPCIKVEVF